MTGGVLEELKKLCLGDMVCSSFKWLLLKYSA